MKHVLVVDDHTENLYLLRALLQGNGYTVDEARHGAEALEKARLSPPTLVISDLLMPVMDGYTLLRHWKADQALRGVPFIVYTATYTDPRDEQFALDLGADAFIIKPCEPDIFMSRVQDTLERTTRGQASPRAPTADEHSTLQIYSEVLVRKLEQKASELEAQVAELTRAEERIRRLNSYYAALSQTNQAIVHLTDQAQLFETVCRIAVQCSGFTMAWIGSAENANGDITPLAACGDEPAWFARLRPFHTGDTPRTPMELALAQHRPYICNDAPSDPALTAIRAHLLESGINAIAAFPLRIGARIIAGLELFSADRGAFDDRVEELLTEMVTDISFALENYEKEALRKQGVDRLRASEEACRLNSRAVEASANGIMITDFTAGNTLIYVNPAFERITGYSAAEVMGRDPSFLLGEDREQIGLEEIRAALHEQHECEVVIKNYRKDASLFWNELSIAPVRDENGRTTHYVGVINDITERKRYEEELERHANLDLLTGLANRNLLKDRITQAINFAARAKRRMAVMLIDLDHFKRINDSLGHEFGDALLQSIATRLNAVVGQHATLARAGGDEFVIVLPDISSSHDAAVMAIRLQYALIKPVTVQERSFNVTTSIGISLYPEDGGDHDQLLKNADAAMYQCKESGRNTYRFYTADMNASTLAHLELEQRLHHVLERDELVLHYQPVLDLKHNTITDVEALLRWRGADGRLIAPADFIPLAEDTGLIIPIGEWVLRTACRQLAQWQRDGARELRVAVNLSARQFSDSHLVSMVRDALDSSGLPPHCLKIEVTESAVMDDAARTVRILTELKALGVGISVDDFGTGYSSLAYLRTFPIEQLKIDRSFVQEVIDHPESAAIVHGIIGLARSLKLQTVAEGVETVAQREFLRAAGCDKLQGYLFSRPLPPAELHSLLLNHQAVPG
jgi:diguanylate cyclase (GGDEF)-like protein/PAS domain S-box-containing protein